jgi:hypothetical protein
MDPEEDNALDIDEEETPASEVIVEPDAEPAAPTPELSPEIEEEIKRALVTDEIDDQGDTPKAKTHQIPVSLIESELTVDDLFDEGSI